MVDLDGYIATATEDRTVAVLADRAPFTERGGLFVSPHHYAEAASVSVDEARALLAAAEFERHHPITYTLDGHKTSASYMVRGELAEPSEDERAQRRALALDKGRKRFQVQRARTIRGEDAGKLRDKKRECDCRCDLHPRADFYELLTWNCSRAYQCPALTWARDRARARVPLRTPEERADHARRMLDGISVAPAPGAATPTCEGCCANIAGDELPYVFDAHAYHESCRPR